MLPNQLQSKLFAEQKVTETYRNDVTRLREKTTSQYLEISILQAKLAKAEQERDHAITEKAATEQAHENTKAEVNSTLFDFYVHSVIWRGSLSFLGPKYETTLAEVWKRILETTRDGGYEEEELIAHFLDDEARVALARGNEQLARESCGEWD